MQALRATVAMILTSVSLVACGEDPAAQRQRARTAFARGDMAAALEVVEQLRERPPEDSEGVLELARFMLQVGEAPQAAWLLEDALRRSPGDARLRLRLGRVALVLRDPSRSLAAVTPIDLDSEYGFDALLIRARAELELGDLEAGLASLEDAARRRPDRPEARLAKIETLLQEKRLDDAQAELANVRLSPDLDAVAQRRFELIAASLDARQERTEEAVARVGRLIDADPLEPQAWNALLSLSIRSGRGEAFGARLDAAEKQYPEQPLFATLRAELAVHAGKADEAEAALRRRLELAPSPSAWFDLGRFLLAQDEPERAAAVFAEALEAFPAASRLHLHLAEAQLEVGALDFARESLAALAAAAPGDPHVDYLRARLALANGDAAAAARELGEVVSRLDAVYTQYWFGRALAASGDVAGAERRYRLAAQRDRASPGPVVALLQSSAQRGDAQAVASAAEQLVRRAPRSIENHEMLVDALIRVGRVRAAEERARRLRDQLPDRPGPALLLARALRAQARYPEAEAALAESEALREFATEVALERALIEARSGKLPAAIERVEALVADEEKNAFAWRTLTDLHYAAGNEIEGSRAAERALDLAPDDPGPLALRARFHVARGNWSSAQEDARSFLAQRPQDAYVHFLLGAALKGAGDTAAAIDAYQRAAALDERDFGSRNNLALILAQRGELDAALRYAQEAWALAPGNPNVADTLGALYLEKGFADRAMAFLKLAHPDDADTEELRPGTIETEHSGESTEANTDTVADTVADTETAAQRALAAGLAALDRPNVILLVVDTLRADRTTPYGSPRNTTPELARWAERGIVFERARAQSSWTKISMASLMTSLWPRSHGITEARDGLGENAITLAEALRDAGYATYGVQTNGWLHQSFGFHQGFERYAFPTGGRGGALARSSLWPHADNVYREALRLLDAHDPAKPMFLYLHFMDVHEYAAPPEFRRFGSDAEGAYHAAIRWVDDSVRRIREALDERGMLENSVMVFASDHGETFGEHRVHGHARNVLTPVVSVPLVIRLPFEVESVRIGVQVRNLDLAPTLLELAGVSTPASFEGTSLLPLATGSEAAADRPSFARLGVPLFPDASIQSAVNDGTWTYARNAAAEEDPDRAHLARARAPGRELLFDRRVDPGENVDLIEIEPERAARLRGVLEAHEAVGEGGVRARGVRIDPGIAERLRALGYLQ